jgi:hypothetical protein
MNRNSSLKTGILAALTAAFLLAPILAHATGAYVFAGFGGRRVADDDMSDFLALGPEPGPTFVPAYLGEGSLVFGYRFYDPFALEFGGSMLMGRESSTTDNLGSVDVQIPSGALMTVSVAPVYCFETASSASNAWFHQVGLRLEHAEVSGQESIESADGTTSTQNFSGTAFGGALFYRIINLWAPARLSVGLEGGYEYLRFNSLNVSSCTGVFAEQASNQWTNLNGNNAYLDESGPYLRLVIGWAADSWRYMGFLNSSKDSAWSDVQPPPAPPKIHR